MRLHRLLLLLTALATLLAPKGELNLNFGDDIIAAVVVTANGEIRHEPTRLRLSMPPLKQPLVESAK